VPQELAGIKLAVLGGDRRELELVRILAENGAVVHIAGLPEIASSEAVQYFREIEEAIQGVDCIIGPATGIDGRNNLKNILQRQDLIVDEEFFSYIGREGIPMLIGVSNENIKVLAEKHNVRLLSYMNRDDIAILNAIPTAEGAIKIAIEETDITIHGAKIAVLGLGRIGIPLARRLHLLGAKVYGFELSSVNCARARDVGVVETAPIKEFMESASDFDLIFNTIPAKVITAEIISCLRKETVIIDLASAPGGTDFSSAEENGIKAILALGLPGKTAPKTAGRIIGQVISGIIREMVFCRQV
jgi:dipicolinate synthase subunit A